MENTQRVKIKADVMWAYLDRQNEMSGKYQVDLCNLSDAAVQALEDMGLTVRQKEDKGYFITCKSNNPIKPLDNKGDTIEGVSVGNGSKAVALVGFYEWTWKNKQGVSPSLKKLVIDKLETYEGAEPVADTDDDEIL
ncbi:MAG: hypothetical protein VW270_08430 [Candidatus Poseidoniales archaeon]